MTEEKRGEHELYVSAIM